MASGAYFGGFHAGVPKSQKFWLAIGTTVHHLKIYKCMKQQTILCLAAQIRIG